MTLCSSVLGRKIISKSDCCVIGGIENVYFDKKCKKIEFFVVTCVTPVCPAGKTGSFAVPFDAVDDFNDVAVLEDSAALISVSDVDFTSYIGSLTGKEVYTVDGSRKGTVSDVAFDERGRAQKFYYETGFYIPADFKRIGDFVLLKPEVPPDKPKKRRIPRPKTERKVTVIGENAASIAASSSNAVLDENKTESGLNADACGAPLKQVDVNAQFDLQSEDKNAAKTFANTTTEIVGQTAETAERQPIIAEELAKSIENSSVSVDGGHTPARIICNYDFLLGRTLAADLTTYTGDPIAPCGSVITNKIVEQARLSGKLIDLILNSK